MTDLTEAVKELREELGYGYMVSRNSDQLKVQAVEGCTLLNFTQAQTIREKGLQLQGIDWDQRKAYFESK